MLLLLKQSVGSDGEALPHAVRSAAKSAQQYQAASYEAAKQQCLELNRNTQKRGMHEFFDAEKGFVSKPAPVFQNVQVLQNLL